MDKPFAITLDAGSSLANKTGFVAHGAAPLPEFRYRRATTPVRPGEHPGLVVGSRGGPIPARLATAGGRQSFPAIMGRVCYHPARPPATVHNWINRWASTPSNGSWATWHSTQGWQLPVEAVDSGKRVLVVGAGPSGLSAAYHLRRAGHHVVIHDAGPEVGRHDAVRHPVLPAAPRHSRRGIQRIPTPGGTASRFAGDRRDGCEGRGRLRRRVRGGRCAVGKRAYVPAGESAKILDAVSLLRDMEGQQAPRLGRRVVVCGGGNTAMDAARTAKRLGGGGHRGLPTHRDRMPAHDVEVQEALEEGVLIRWVDDQDVDAGSMTVERMELDDLVPAADRRVRATRGRLAGAGTGAGHRPVAADRTSTGIKDLRCVEVDEGMMTGGGIFAGGDMVPSERTVTVAVGHGKQTARTSTAGCAVSRSSTEKPPLATFDRLNTWYYTDAPKTVRPTLDWPDGCPFDEVGRVSMSRPRCTRRSGAACPAATASAVTAASGLPRQRSAETPRGFGRRRQQPGLCLRPRLLQGCGICVSECPSGAIIMIPEA